MKFLKNEKLNKYLLTKMNYEKAAKIKYLLFGVTCVCQFIGFCVTAYAFFTK